MASAQGAPRLRYPIALAFADSGKLLLAANERSGSISIVQMSPPRVLAECPIGKHLSDLVAVRGSGGDELFLCTDSDANKLYLLARQGTELKVIDSLKVRAFPASVRASENGRQCFVASLWSRRLTVADLVRDEKGSVHLKIANVMPLPFPPRLQALNPDGKTLVVGGAFGGELAVVHPAAAKVELSKTVPGQNIRGLAWSADGRRLYVSHQTLNRLAYTSQEDLHWGSVVSNVLRSLERESLEQPKTDVLTGSQVVQLGEVGDGGGDPAALAVMKDGDLSVALAGVGEVASGRFDTGRFRRLNVGVRPTAMLTSEDGKTLYVADTFGDSIAMIPVKDLKAASPPKSIVRLPLGLQPQLSSAERGERLFFDARLGLERWMSCQSCHPDGQSSDALSDTLGDGTFGAAKRIPPLGGVGETGPWAWNGSIHDLGDQVRKSLQTTLRTKSVTSGQVADLTAYLKTLKPAPPENATADATEKLAIERGHGIFARQKCDRCHVPPTFTSPSLYDVGLRDEVGNRRFNPPSLRGAGQRVAFFHDGRATSLRDVFSVHHHPGTTQLPEADLIDLLAFLRSV
ncbi:MAG TPA: cytochrome c peroxidase [Planctomycetaceae bacterium]|jgi:mono/diheme cytochrome c family protein|nr:cytochrome c peroxidase [Planctomycetaceae bacterium]